MFPTLFWLFGIRHTFKVLIFSCSSIGSRMIKINSTRFLSSILSSCLFAAYWHEQKNVASTFEQIQLKGDYRFQIFVVIKMKGKS